MSKSLGIQKNKQIVAFALIVLALGILASLLAKQCQFLPSCNEPNYNPAVITGGQ